MASSPPVTLTDKLMLIPDLARSIFSAASRTVSRPFTHGAKPNSAFKDALYAALRTHLSTVSNGTERFLDTPTDTSYLQFAKSEKFQPDIDELDEGTKLLWIGDKNAKTTLLYFHGGGYALSASPGLFSWLFDLQRDLSKQHSINVAIVKYTLSGAAAYPTQLRQAAISLQYLLTNMNKTPSNIFVGGDSAGGNMAIALLSHILHPHPDVSTKIQLHEPLAGALLISPWVSFSKDFDSVKRNEMSDYVTAGASGRWSSAFMGTSPLDGYNFPYHAEDGWFKGLNSAVKRILVWVGGGEILQDSVEMFTKKIQAVHMQTELVMEPGAAHEEFLIDRLLGYKEKAEGTKAIEGWMSKCL